MSISANCLRINDAMPPPKRKLELCRSFSEHGFCHYGENCFFAHGLDQLQQHQPTLKKKMCRNYHQHRYCKFGTRCNFVHNPHHPQGPKAPKSLLKMVEDYPQILPFVSFRKKLMTFL